MTVAAPTRRLTSGASTRCCATGSAAGRMAAAVEKAMEARTMESISPPRSASTSSATSTPTSTRPRSRSAGATPMHTGNHRARVALHEGRPGAHEGPGPARRPSDRRGHERRHAGGHHRGDGRRRGSSAPHRRRVLRAPTSSMSAGRNDLADPRFTATYENIAPGLAQYVHDAIMANAARQTPSAGGAGAAASRCWLTGPERYCGAECDHCCDEELIRLPARPEAVQCPATCRRRLGASWLPAGRQRTGLGSGGRGHAPVAAATATGSPRSRRLDSVPSSTVMVTVEVAGRLGKVQSKLWAAGVSHRRPRLRSP